MLTTQRIPAAFLDLFIYLPPSLPPYRAREIHSVLEQAENGKKKEREPVSTFLDHAALEELPSPAPTFLKRQSIRAQVRILWQRVQ